MSAIQITPPAVEPVSLDEAKAYLRVETTQDDGLISALISAARSHVEALSGRKLITQTWRLYRDGLPQDGRVSLALAPLISIDAVTLYDGQGDASAIDAGDYLVDSTGTPPRIQFRKRLATSIRALNGVEIDVSVGYGPTSLDVPSPLRQAVMDLVADWYDHRGGGLDMAMMREPQRIAMLIEPYRSLSL